MAKHKRTRRAEGGVVLMEFVEFRSVEAVRAGGLVEPENVPVREHQNDRGIERADEARGEAR